MTESTTELDTYIVDSGVRFPGSLPDGSGVTTKVQATFIQIADGQLQQLFVGTEPVLIVQPEFDADAMEVTLVLTGVEINPPGLVQIFETLLDAARLMVEKDSEHLEDLDERERQAAEQSDSI